MGRGLPAAGVCLLALGSIIATTGPAVGSTHRLGTSPSVVSRALPALPTPGSAQQVASLVSAAPRITVLPTVTVPSLADAAANRPGAYYPSTLHGCTKPTTCVYGDTSASRTIVLFGDSHAVMWLPALAPIGEALGYRIVLLYQSACPAVSVTVYLAPGQDGHVVGYANWCDVARRNEMAAIAGLKPALVLVADKTFWDYSSPTSFFTARQWKRGLQRTVDKLRTFGSKVAVVGDNTWMPASLPQCLAAYPNSIQRCGGPSPNASSHGNQAAELAEAKALGIPYIKTNQWICSNSCSPVVGNMIVYLDQSHINAVYAEYLTGVMETAIAHVLGVSAPSQAAHGIDAAP